MREDDEQTRALQELCSMTSEIFRSPPLRIAFPRLSQLSPPPCSSSSPSPSPPPPEISPAAFGMLFIGISVALMLFGLVTLIIGIILMPLVITLVFLFYFVGMLSNLSKISRAIFCPAPHSYNFVSVWNYSR